MARHSRHVTRKLAYLIKKELGDLKGDFVALIIVNPETLMETNMELVKTLRHERQMPGVYITGNMPYENLKKHFDEHKVDRKDMKFIDCVTEMTGEMERVSGECAFIDSPQSLTELGSAFDDAISSLKGKEKFLILDSISTLLIYNKERIVERFTHLLTTKIREKPGVKGILIAVQTDENQGFLKMLSQFCDKVVRL